MNWPRILDKPMDAKEIKLLAYEYFGDMIKLVVDIKEGKLAAGGSLHADAEQILLKDGSEQDNIWGANYFPFRNKGERLECTALINIRPKQGNRSQLIESADIRGKVSNIAEKYFEL